jgi:hypothetical protein
LLLFLIQRLLPISVCSLYSLYYAIEIEKLDDVNAAGSGVVYHQDLH